MAEAIQQEVVELVSEARGDRPLNKALPAYN